MQILNSGSFINLDNKEKIENLIFTAKEMARAAVETEGFVNEAENNRRLALEIWQGAEYMTREHEQARVQNIFIDNFLDRLGEIAPAVAAASGISENCETAAAESDTSKDEYLGFVTTTENESREIGNANEIGGNAEPTNFIEVSPPDIEIAANVQVESIEPLRNESAEILTREASTENQSPQTPEIEAVEPKIVEPVEQNQSSEIKIADVSQIGKSEKPAIAAITLSEKEPYRWDDCTVTATLQLLPTESGKRRAVLSVRTHDFAPQISVVELEGAATPEQILPALAETFEKYKADLPIKVMDKMKREKSAGKKGAGKQTQETKTSAPVANQSVEAKKQTETKTVETTVSVSANNQAATTAATSPAASQSVTPNRSKPSVKNSKPETSAQGNLFGF